MIYRALVYLYPPAFRREFGDEIMCDLDDGARDAWRATRWAGVIAFCAVVGADLVERRSSSGCAAGGRRSSACRSPGASHAAPSSRGNSRPATTSALPCREKVRKTS